MLYKVEWDYFKVSPQHNASTLVKAIYGSDLILMPSSGIKMAVDTLEAKEVTSTLVTNKKYKRKVKAPFISSMSFSNSKGKILLILQASSLSKTMILFSLKTSDILFWFSYDI